MSISISMIAFADDTCPSVGEIQHHLESTWPELPKAENAEESDNTISFEIGEANVILGHMPAPIPWSDLEGPCATSIYWPHAEEALKQHTSHLIVTVSDECEPLQRIKLLTQVTVAILAASPTAIGVYWCDATLVIPKDMFVEVATNALPHELPLILWIDFRVGQDDDGGTSGFTNGLAALGLMELEAKNTPESIEDLHDRLGGLAEYLVENGLVIRDGDTLGHDKNERIRVVYSKSSFGHDEQVMRLDYGDEPDSRMTSAGCFHAVATLAITIVFGFRVYSSLEGLISSGLLRVFVLLIPLAIFGLVFLVVTAAMLSQLTGYRMFEEVATEEATS